MKHQAAAALNTDMGVRTSYCPVPGLRENQGNCGETSRMLADGDLNNLVTYPSTLGVRPQRGLETGFVNTTVERGKAGVQRRSVHGLSHRKPSRHPLSPAGGSA